MTSKRVAGVAYLKTDGEQMPLAGTMTVSFNEVTREAVTGLSGVVGYKETPRAPFVEADVVLTSELSLKKISDFKDGTIVAELANGNVYTLHDAFFAGDLDADAAEGSAPLRFEGTKMDEKL